MKLSQLKQSVILKSSVRHWKTFYRCYRQEAPCLVLAYNRYVQWFLVRRDVPSRLMEDRDPHTSWPAVHRHLEAQFKRIFETPGPRFEGIDCVDLLKNHLIWEIQEPYLIILQLERHLRQSGAKRLFMESLPVADHRKKRFAPDMNDYVREYFEFNKFQVTFL